MKDMTLNEIRRTTTPEYLGTTATQADVESYLALLAENGPDDNPDGLVDGDVAQATQDLTFKAWCSPKPAVDPLKLEAAWPR